MPVLRDAEVTSGMRDASGTYEYFIQVSVYCEDVFATSPLSLLPSGLPYDFRNVDGSGRTQRLQVRLEFLKLHVVTPI